MQNPQYGNLYAACKYLISYTRRGLKRSGCLTLGKFRDPQLGPLAVLSPWAPAPLSPGVKTVVQEPVLTVLSQLGAGFGQESEKGWET